MHDPANYNREHAPDFMKWSTSDDEDNELLAAAAIRPSVRISTVAAKLDMDQSQIRRLLASGELQEHRIGKRGIRIYVDAITDYQRRHAIGTPAAKTPPPRTRSTRRDPGHEAAVAYLRKLGIV
jgi:hypothetical protein